MDALTAFQLNSCSRTPFSFSTCNRGLVSAVCRNRTAGIGYMKAVPTQIAENAKGNQGDSCKAVGAPA